MRASLGLLLLSSAFLGCDGSSGPGLDLSGAGDLLASGMTDMVDAAPPGCGNVPISGVCASDGEVETCTQPQDGTPPTVMKTICPDYQVCGVKGGVAACGTKMGDCDAAASECAGATHRNVCRGRSWTVEDCAGCRNSPVGALCGSGLPTVDYTGSLAYEMRAAGGGWDDWSKDLTIAVAQGVLAVSYVHDDAMNADTPLDAVLTDDKGRYRLRLPAAPGPRDTVVFWALRPKPGGLDVGVAFAVGEPDVPDGAWNVATPLPRSAKHRLWGWSYATAALLPGATTTIKEVDGSGVLRVFDFERYIHESCEDITKQAGLDVVIWMRPNTSWSCGSCFGEAPITVDGQDFNSQLYIPMTAQNMEYWSDAVSSHELGHWMMASYGTNPGEGGAHQAACPTYPGQAWSEGWATGFSSLVRASPRFYDKQGGTFYWWDLDRKVYGAGWMWTRPNPSDGLLQLIDENEIASMLWLLADSPDQPGMSLVANKAYFDAIMSKRLNDAPYGRKYTRHVWDGACDRKNIVDTHDSTMMFADFLDALVCGGKPAAHVDAATNPKTSYPYDSANPICK